MTMSEYEKFAVHRPIFATGYPAIKGRQAPPMIFLSKKQVPEANCYIEFGWIYDIPQSNPHIGEYVLAFDEILLFIGCNPDMPQDLGGTIEFYLGGQPIIFNTTTSIFTPRGTPRGPLSWKEVRYPHIHMNMILDNSDPFISADPRVSSHTENTVPRKKTILTTSNMSYGAR